ncbi:integrase arm-type DNA-binding domain-containing protein [Halovulum dunhuangense]|uniref:Integrase arm-type DNA-binding domain-containing protein n=1 Tax=Halovulum dunhuangense TaxID=1505036 RepID=A0A849L2I2_9RHOB|nr:site-specific integrase [Halovulum dunhuangense]NNU80411.1 integrase arm-type DNA-binding domain-containing protein [Halovulum dunhuangense]
MPAAPAKKTSDKGLSAAFVRTVKVPGKYHDGGGLGLYLRVTESGARSWVQRITIRGRRSEIGLGSPPVVTLAEARERALENSRVARSGGDPLQMKRATHAVPTFEEAARKVHALHAPSWRNNKHAAQFISTLETYAFPRVGRLKVGEVTTGDVLAILTPIWFEKPETARRVKQRIGTVLKWAIAQGWRQDNPAESISQALPKHDRSKSHRKALPHQEVAACLAKVRASEAWIATKLALEFLVLTAARSGEVRGARWEEIEFSGGAGDPGASLVAAWVLPAGRMKMKKAHRVPLSRRAMEVLRDAEALKDGSGLIFPSLSGKPLSDMTLSKLVKQLGFDADVHGFRTSFRTWAQERTSFPREVAEAALAHKVGDAVEQAYARSDLFEKRRLMMEAWANYLQLGEGKVLEFWGQR